MDIATLQSVPPLDPGFLPSCVVNRAYRSLVEQAPAKHRARVAIAVEREEGLVGRHDVEIRTDPAHFDDTLRFVQRHLKFVLWFQGGWRVVLHGPSQLCETLRQTFGPQGERAFDGDIMKKVYGRDLEVDTVAEESAVPDERTASQAVGGHLQGCRIGFDLGASDYKLAAVKDGEPVFSTEIPWDPVPQTEPDYHYEKIVEGLRLAASKLPRVDAIGGSAAGIYIDNEVKVASLFRGISEDRFERDVKGLFRRIGSEWGVPLVVVNDGDVTALAGAMSLETSNLLGIAMGSSEAVGFVDANSRITGCLNELAFAPADENPAAAVDEWSGDRGVGALYFSQQAVNKLLPAAEIDLPADKPLPEKLKDVQKLADGNDPRAEKIFRSIGVYLGYSLVHYHDYYGYDNVLLLGRVTSGTGGEIILEQARKTLTGAYPALSDRIAIRVPDEKSRRVGQAVAAASLPSNK